VIVSDSNLSRSLPIEGWDVAHLAAMRISTLIGWGLGAILVSCGDGSPAHEEAGGAGSVAADGGGRRIAASASHGCALRGSGLYCWGDNFVGQLGTGDTTDAPERPVKAQIAAGDVAEIAADSGRTCARRKNGEVACWGDNAQGQIGDGTRDNASTPLNAGGVRDARQLAIDDVSSCVLHADRTVSCWGASPDDEATSGSLIARPIAGAQDVIDLRGGVRGTYCARTQAGPVHCWRLQDGVWSAALEVPSLAGARSVAVTFQDEVCGIVPSDAIVCHNLDSGHDGTLGTSQGALELVSGLLSVCARKTSGWSCWNVLPSMLELFGSAEIPLSLEMPLLEVAIGGLNACALRADQSVVCADASSISSAPNFAMHVELPP